MTYIKHFTTQPGQFAAEFHSGATTESHDTVCFFMAMQDSGVPAAELETHIKLAETAEADDDHDWLEIRRVEHPIARRHHRPAFRPGR